MSKRPFFKASDFQVFRLSVGLACDFEQIVWCPGFARALSAVLASAPRREPRRRRKPLIALFVAEPTHELASICIPLGHRIRKGAKLFGLDSFARPDRRRKPRDFLPAPGNYHSRSGLDPVDQSAQM